MKQNKYDDPEFFAAYAQMPRSAKGLEASGEWPAFRSALPTLRNKRVLDLGCGYGWHCKYAAEQGATSVVGLDVSEKMIAKAQEINAAPNTRYIQAAIEDYDARHDSFDVVISSLALHYVKDLAATFVHVSKLLGDGGVFCYSTEHPVFTSRPQQDWCYGTNGEMAHWPIDQYFDEGERHTQFLGSDVIKYHRTIATHFQALRAAGFTVESLIEPTPPAEIVERMGWQNELRRPMMLILRGVRI